MPCQICTPVVQFVATWPFYPSGNITQCLDVVFAYGSDFCSHAGRVKSLEKSLQYVRFEVQSTRFQLRSTHCPKYIHRVVVQAIIPTLAEYTRHELNRRSPSIESERLIIQHKQATVIKLISLIQEEDDVGPVTCVRESSYALGRKGSE